MSDPKPPRAIDQLQKGLSRLFGEKAPAPAPAQPTEPAIRPAAKRPAATLAAVAQLRIQFLDNTKRPLYPVSARGTAPLSRDEEAVALSRCVDALHEAKAAGKLLGKPPVGAYAGRDAEEVLAQATIEDVKTFLAFVLASPRTFIGEPRRFSEAFLAWLVDRGEP